MKRRRWARELGVWAMPSGHSGFVLTEDEELERERERESVCVCVWILLELANGKALKMKSKKKIEGKFGGN